MPEQNSPSPTVVTPSSASSAPALRPVGALLQDAWSLYMTRFGVLIGVSLVPALFVVLATLVGVASFSATFETFFYAKELTTAVLNAIAVVLVFAVLAAGIFIWGYAALLVAITTSARPTIIDAYRRGWKLLGAYAWISILSGLCVVAGLILLIVPGVIIGVWFMFAGYVLAVEGIRGGDALRKSKAYVQGRWWAVFWRVCAVYLIYFIIGAGVNAFEGALGSDIEAGSAVVDLLVAPFMSVYLFLMYQDLKALPPVAK